MQLPRSGWRPLPLGLVRSLPLANRLIRIWGFNVPSCVRVFPHLPIPTYQIIFFRKQCPHFNSLLLKSICRVWTPHKSGSSSCFTLTSNGIRFYIWLSAIFTLGLEEIKIFRAHIESFRSLLWFCCWEFKCLSSYFSFTMLTRDIRSKQPTSLCLLVFQKCLKIVYTVTSSLLVISHWIGISM